MHAPFRPQSPRWAAAALEHRGQCLSKPCLNEPGYDNEWAVPLYAAPLGMGQEGKVCADPLLACITLMPYVGWIVWCRNNVRATPSSVSVHVLAFPVSFAPPQLFLQYLLRIQFSCK